MLAHILTCLSHKGIRKVELLCVDEFPNFPGINHSTDSGNYSRNNSHPSILADVPSQTSNLGLQPSWTGHSQLRIPPCSPNCQKRPSHLCNGSRSGNAMATGTTRPDNRFGAAQSLAFAAIRAGCETPGRFCVSGCRSIRRRNSGEIQHCGPKSMDSLTVCLRSFRLKDLRTGCLNGRARCRSRNSRSKLYPDSPFQATADSRARAGLSLRFMC